MVLLPQDFDFSLVLEQHSLSFSFDHFIICSSQSVLNSTLCYKPKG